MTIGFCPQTPPCSPVRNAPPQTQEHGNESNVRAVCCLSACPSVGSACLFAGLVLGLSRLPAHLSVCLSVCWSVRLPGCLPARPALRLADWNLSSKDLGRIIFFIRINHLCQQINFSHFSGVWRRGEIGRG